MKLALILIFVSFSAEAVNLKALAPYVYFHDLIVSGIKDKSFNGNWKLSRYDADLAVDVGGDIGVFGAGASAGAELIWERENSRKDNPETLEISINPEKKSQTAEDLLELLSPILELHRFSHRRIKRFANFLRDDAEVIHRMHDALASVPEIGGWRATGFFKIYEFTTGLELSPVGGAYEKRIRIRFSVTPKPQSEIQKTANFPTPAKVRKILSQLSQISSAEMSPDAFVLSRAWIRSDVIVGFDLGFLENSVTKGLVVQLQKTKSISGITPPKGKLLSIPGTLVLPPSLNSDFPLSQVRLRLSAELERGFSFADLGSEATVDLHYMREGR